MASYKKKVLGVLHHIAMQKVEKKKHDLVWESQYISRGFTYDGVSFVSRIAQGVPVPMSKEQAESLGVPDIAYMLKEWETVRHYVICWLNQSKDIEACCMWLPVEAMEYITNPPPIPEELPQWVIDIKESEPYQSLLALVHYNVIAE
ncbi:hypothetical protein VPHD292_0042 [Vibrio phage D292]